MYCAEHRMARVCVVVGETLFRTYHSPFGEGDLMRSCLLALWRAERTFKGYLFAA